jgi:hypothetical protein
MGYRSQFILAFEGDTAKIEEMRTWMLFNAKATTGTTSQQDRQEIFETLAECESEKAQITRDGTLKRLLYEDDYCKCYGPWDDVVHDILRHAREELNIIASYGRLGEEMDDYEFDNDSNGDINVFYERNLIDPFE